MLPKVVQPALIIMDYSVLHVQQQLFQILPIKTIFILVAQVDYLHGVPFQ